VTTTYVKAADTQGLALKNSSGTTVVTVTDAGAVTGPISITLSNTASGAPIQTRYNTSNANAVMNYYCTNGNPYFGLNTVQTASSDDQTYSVSNFAAKITLTGALEFWTAASGTAGNTITWIKGISVADTGAVTLGPSGFTGTHTVNGRIDCIAPSGLSAFDGYRKTSTAADSISILYSDVGGTKVLKWRVEADGDTISATGSYTSDARAKKNLSPITYGLAEILKLSPKSFNWWHEEDSDTKSFCISTAQEVQTIMPEMVREDGLDGPNGDKMKAIYDKEVMAVLVKAVQELSAKLDEANARLAALEAK
jgi:hypothetical protein